MALRSVKVGGKKIRVTGVGRSRARLDVARRLGAVDEYSLYASAGVKDADVIFICLPVDMIAETALDIAPSCKRGAVITDVGSVKKTIVDAVDARAKTLRKSGVFFVGAHPIAGAEKTSVRNARRDMFAGATVVVTPAKTSAPKAVRLVEKLWKTAGANVAVMSPDAHDAKLARTSHLPHAVAYALANSVGYGDLRFAGAGFADSTRIASSSPYLWAQIILSNKKETLKAVRVFAKELWKIARAKSKPALARLLASAKKKRDSLDGVSGK
jgi:prephenate dehydrogenase